ncbi:MAG: NADH-quinone oxidoreductase subunit N [Cytophagaceae bacterium]|nr:NADH-quinone oxidoreductase subunit N [Cytophagaceae bacterium]
MLSIISLSLFGILNLFLGFLKSRRVLLPATLLFIALAFAANLLDWNHQYVYFRDMLRTNNLFINFSSIILLTTFLTVAISRSFGTDEEHTHPAEYYAIMLFSVVGALMMVGFENLIMLFIGLEILSVSLYVLTGSDKRSLRSNEAALKYFLMGSFATGIFLFGIALVYGATGSFNLSAIGSYVSGGPTTGISPLLYVGLLFILAGMLFKVSAAPFHFWTPDVYDGAPTLFTAFMSTVVKTAGFAALYRLLTVSFTGVYGLWWQVLTGVTVLTLLVGNITAVYQSSVKRMLAYSSVSHAGYLLIAVAAKTPQSPSAILFYSLAYSIATITGFAVLILVAEQKPIEGRPDERYEAFNGLAKRNPLLAFSLAVSMVSLAGIPLTAGFWGKFFVFSTAVDRGMTNMGMVLVVAVLMSVVGVYYYFRVIIASYLKTGDSEPIGIRPLYRFILVLTTALTIGLGLFPDVVRQLF